MFLGITKDNSKIVTTFRQWFQECWTRRNHTEKIGVSVILAYALIAPAFGGWDFYTAYCGETLSGHHVYSFNPYPAYWFFFFFAILPPVLGYILWNLANAIGFIYALHYWKTNPLPFSLSIACFWNFFGGQFEGLLAGAIALALNSNVWIAGFAIYLLTFKPQVGLVAILFVFLHRRDWRIFIVPAIIYIASFFYWGWWVPEWLEHIRLGYKVIGTGYTNISLFPIGLVFLLLILRYKKSIRIWTLSASLAMPYFPVYSLASFFTLGTSSWWIHIAIWAFYLALGITRFGETLAQFSFVIPLTFMGLEIWKFEKNQVAR